MGRPRTDEGGGLVLPWRQLRRPRPVAQHSRGAAGRRARRQADQGIARAGRRAGSDDARRALRRWAVSVPSPTWRHRPSSWCAGSCSCPVATARRGCEPWSKRAQARRCCAAKPATSCTSSTCGTRRSPNAPLRWPVSCARDTPTTRTFSRSRPTSTTCTAPIRAPACRSGGASSTPRRATAWPFQTRPPGGRVWDRPRNSTDWERPISPSTSCGRSWPLHWPRRSAWRRAPIWPWDRHSTAWGAATKPSRNTGWHSPPCRQETRSTPPTGRATGCAAAPTPRPRRPIVPRWKAGEHSSAARLAMPREPWPARSRCAPPIPSRATGRHACSWQNGTRLKALAPWNR